VEEALRFHGVAWPGTSWAARFEAFCEAERPKIAEAHPGMASAEVDTALGAAWGKLSDAQKAHFTPPCDRLPSPPRASGHAPDAPPPPRAPDARAPAELAAVAAPPVRPSPPRAAPPVAAPPPPAIPPDSPFARAAKPEVTAHGGGGGGAGGGGGGGGAGGGGAGGGAGGAAAAPFSFAFSLEAATPKGSTSFRKTT